MNLINKLLIAVRSGDVESAQTCIDQGISVGTCGYDEEGTTPLHEAIAFNHSPMAEFLIRNGADVNLKNRGGMSPLHWAFFFRNQAVIDYLLNNGADINEVGQGGNTLLHGAASHGSDILVERFLDRGANINIKNYNGETPLHLAARSSLSRTTILLDRQPYINFPDYRGYTPLHVAVTDGSRSTVELLLQVGAYTFRFDKADHTLLRYWKQPVVNTPEDLRFYTTLLLSGVSTRDNVLPEPLSMVQRNIESTINDWLGPLALSAEELRELGPIFLRALRALLLWLKHSNNTGKISLFSVAQETKDNIDLLRNLNAAMPAELVTLIREDCINQNLAKALVNALMEMHPLPHFFAKYVVQDCMKYTKRYALRYSQLFTHDWQTPLPDSNTNPIAEATSTLQNFHL